MRRLKSLIEIFENIEWKKITRNMLHDVHAVTSRDLAFADVETFRQVSES